jgi:hypothetical protein
MCYWATIQFVDCNDRDNHSFQMGMKCNEADKNGAYCDDTDDEPWEELDTTNPSRLRNIKYPCAL